MAAFIFPSSGGIAARTGRGFEMLRSHARMPRAGVCLAVGALLGLLQGFLYAQVPKALVDAPSAISHPTKVTPKAVHPFRDTPNLIAFSSLTISRTMDAVQSCQLLSDGGREKGLPWQTCAPITAFSEGMVGAGVAGAYALHRMGHHRLERVVPWAIAVPAVVGIFQSRANWPTVPHRAPPGSITLIYGKRQ